MRATHTVNTRGGTPRSDGTPTGRGRAGPTAGPTNHQQHGTEFPGGDTNPRTNHSRRHAPTGNWQRGKRRRRRETIFGKQRRSTQRILRRRGPNADPNNMGRVPTNQRDQLAQAQHQSGHVKVEQRYRQGYRQGPVFHGANRKGHSRPQFQPRRGRTNVLQRTARNLDTNMPPEVSTRGRDNQGIRGGTARNGPHSPI